MLSEPSDGAELIDLEACASDECTVNVGLAHEARDVVRLHRTAVQDAGRCSHFLAEEFLERGTESVSDGLRLLGRGSLAGTDGPDGLIGDDEVRSASTPSSAALS